jgi:hypothetical protein
LHEFASIPFGPRIQQWAHEYGKIFGIYEGERSIQKTSETQNSGFKNQVEQKSSRNFFGRVFVFLKFFEPAFTTTHYRRRSG